MNSAEIPRERKTAIVTGAGRGIGEAIARMLFRAGYRLLLAARSEDELKQVQESLSSDPAAVSVCRCDVRSAKDVSGLMQQCSSDFARLDVLVNNAGVGDYLTLDRTSDASIDATLETNLRGTILCCREALPLLRANPGATIINIASIAAVRAFAGFSVYSAAKAGVVAFSNALREELRKDMIRVCTVLPGPTVSDFWNHIEGDWDRSRMMSADDVAQAVAAMLTMPPTACLDELVLMPAGGSL
jgi:short-subunit dehydrogenase